MQNNKNETSIAWVVDFFKKNLQYSKYDFFIYCKCSSFIRWTTNYFSIFQVSGGLELTWQ